MGKLELLKSAECCSQKCAAYQTDRGLHSKVQRGDTCRGTGGQAMIKCKMFCGENWEGYHLDLLFLHVNRSVELYIEYFEGWCRSAVPPTCLKPGLGHVTL